MSLNGSLCLKDASGRIQLATVDVTVPDGFNGGTPTTVDRRLCITGAIGLPLPRLAGLLYDPVGRLSVTTVGPAVDWVEGLPLDANGRLFTSNIGAIVMHIPDGVPLTATGAVATTGAGGGGDTTPPTDPTLLTATPDSDSQITLDWVASTDDVGVAGYSIERCTGVSCTDFVQVGTSVTDGFVDTGLTPGTTYRYRVLAYDDAANLSGYSNVVEVTTPAMPSLSLGDVAIVSDAIAFSTGRTLADTVTVSDLLTPAPTKSLADSVTVTDTMARSVSSVLTDSLTVSDLIANTPGKALTDSLTVSDLIANTPTVALGDSLMLTDSISFSGNGSANLTDDLSVTDAITFQVTRGALTDSATISDQITFGVTPGVLADSVTVSDLIAFTPTKALTDSATVSDSPPSMTVSRSLTDSVTVSDGVPAMSVTKGVLTDSLTVSDNLVAGLVFSANLSDSLTVDDALTPTYTPGAANETIRYVGGQVAGRAGATSGLSVTFNLTGGTETKPQTGDLVVVTAVVGASGTNAAMAITTPAGYTALGQLNQSAATNDVSMNVSYKFMGGTPDTTVTIPACAANTDGQAYAIQVFRNVDQTTPMDVTAVSAGGTGTGRPNPGSINPSTVPGAMLVLCGGGAAVTGANYGPPTHFSNGFLTAFGADNFDAMVGAGWRDLTGLGLPVDPLPYTGGTANAADSWAAYTLALRPAAGTAHSTPADLFAAGEPGGWYDPSDFSTMFLDTAGTAPVTTVGQAVARVNDKSGRGNHLTQAASGGRPTIDCRVNMLDVSEEFTDAYWTKWEVIMVTDAIAGPTSVPGIGMADGIIGTTTNQLHYVLATSQTVAATAKFCYSVYVKNGAGFGNVTLNVLDASAGTSEMRVELDMANGGLVTMATVGSTFTVSGYGVEPVTADGWYRIWIAGNPDNTTTTRRARVTIRNAVGQAFLPMDGTTIQCYVTGFQMEPGVGPPSKYQRVNSASDYDTSGFPWYLNFDGVDDFLSASVDLSTVSKVAAWAGVYKASDTNVGSLAGLTADPANTAGSFHLTAPDSAGTNTYGWGSRGSVASASATASLAVAPDLSVVAATADIAADSKILRRNGAQVGTNTADQGTGNYANATLYVGERGGTQFPFTGRLYGLIIRGGATQATTAQVRDLEQWMAGKTGITFA